MSEFTKADGAKIQIEFSQPLVGDCAGNEGAFTVTVPEYTMVPGGEIEYNQKTVKSTSVRCFYQETLNLGSGTMTDTEISGGSLTLKGA